MDNFWHFLRQHYAADHIVAEVENLVTVQARTRFFR